MKAKELIQRLEGIGLFEYQPVSGDEQDFADRRIVMEVLLPWLGWSEKDYRYNTLRAEAKPDFLVFGRSTVIFFIEDKSTSESIGENIRKHASQVISYLRKFVNKGIVCNGFELLVLEGYEDSYRVLYHIDFRKAHSGLYRDTELAKISAFYREFSKERFTSLESRLSELAKDKETFLHGAVSIRGKEETFMSEVSSVLENIRMDVLWRVQNALNVYERFVEDKELKQEDLRKKLETFKTADRDLIQTQAGEREEKKKHIVSLCEKLIENLGNPDLMVHRVKREAEAVRLRELESRSFTEFLQALKDANGELLSYLISHWQAFSIADSYSLWYDKWSEVMTYTGERGRCDRRICGSGSIRTLCESVYSQSS